MRFSSLSRGKRHNFPPSVRASTFCSLPPRQLLSQLPHTHQYNLLSTQGICRSLQMSLHTALSSPVPCLVNSGLLAPSLQLRKSSGFYLGTSLHHGLETLGNKLWGPCRILSFISHLLEITILHCHKPLFHIFYFLFSFGCFSHAGKLGSCYILAPKYKFYVYMYIDIGALSLLLLLLLP